MNDLFYVINEPNEIEEIFKNDEEEINWIKTQLQQKNNPEEWLAYRIYYSEDFFQHLPISILQNSSLIDKIDISKKEEYLNDPYQIYDLFFNEKNDLFILKQNIKIEEILNKYFQFFSIDKSKVRQNINYLIGINIINYYSLIDLQKPSLKNEISVFQKLMMLLKQAIDSPNWNEKFISVFSHQEYMKQLLKLRYPLLIPFNHKMSIKYQGIINNHRRYSSKPITINNKQYLVINDVYQKNLDLLKQLLIKFKLIEDDK